jgi:hypothetical protein
MTVIAYPGGKGTGAVAHDHSCAPVPPPSASPFVDTVRLWRGAFVASMHRHTEMRPNVIGITFCQQ